MSFLPRKAVGSPLSIKGPSLLLHMPSDHVVTITLAEKRFSAWLWGSQSVAASKVTRAVLWLFLLQPCFAAFGQGGRSKTSCSYWLIVFAGTTDIPSSPARGTVPQLLLGSRAAADTTSCARTDEPSKNHAFQKFWGTLLLRTKALTAFPEDNSSIIFFQVQ